MTDELGDLAVLGIPLAGGALLALVGHMRWAAEVNVALSHPRRSSGRRALTARVVRDGPILAFQEQFFVDSLNVFLVALTAFVAMTTAMFSRPYMRIEEDHGRIDAGRLRLYHSMYQLFIFTMLLVLLTNNMGIMWVAMEAATLTTVLLVSLYRTPASLEAAWKYFILCGVGIAQALFGTILLYLAVAEDARGRHRRCCGRISPACKRAARADGARRSRSCSCSSATAPRSGWCRSTTGCRTRTPRARRRCRRCSRGCSSTSRSTRSCAARCSPTARSARRSRAT